MFDPSVRGSTHAALHLTADVTLHGSDRQEGKKGCDNDRRSDCAAVKGTGVATEKTKAVVLNIFDILQFREVFKRIFSNFSPLEITTACVSKKWNRLADCHIFKPLCPVSKPYGVPSWKLLFFNNERLNTIRNIRENPIISYNVDGFRTVYTDRWGRFGCYAWQPRAASYDCVIWDMNTNKKVVTIDRIRGRIGEMAFGYPYLLSSTEQTFEVRDLSSKTPKEPIITWKSENATTRLHQFSINADGLSFIEHAGEKTNLVFYTINDRMDNRFARIAVHKLAIALLLGDRLICSNKLGNIEVRDVTSYECPVIGEISTQRSGASGGIPEDGVEAMVASDNTLVALSKNEILICDLTIMKVVKRLPKPEVCRNIELVVGHTLFISTDTAIQMLDFNGKTINTFAYVYREGDKQRSRSLRSVAHNKGKIFVWELDGGPFSGNKPSLKVYNYMRYNKEHNRSLLKNLTLEKNL